MKKILHVSGSMAIGGAERALYQLIRSQRINGDVSDLVTNSPSGYYSKEVNSIGASVFVLKQSNSFDPTVASRFLKIVKGYDIIHFHVPNPALMLSCFFISHKVKLYYTHRAGKHVYPISRKLVYLAAGIAIRYKFTAISGNTEFASQIGAELFGLGIDRIATTYNGVDFDLLLPKRSREDILNELNDNGDANVVRIMTSGNFRKLKRIDFLVRAIEYLTDKRVICYAIGDGPDLATLKQLANNLQVSDRVKFPGMKEHIGDYLQIADIFVLPSDESESFGNSAIEAMGLGIPVIVMKDGGGLVEHIIDGGGMIADNQQHLSELLSKLIDSASLRKKIGSTGKDYVQTKYTYANMYQAYEKLYNIEASIKCAV